MYEWISGCPYRKILHIDKAMEIEMGFVHSLFYGQSLSTSMRTMCSRTKYVSLAWQQEATLDRGLFCMDSNKGYCINFMNYAQKHVL